MSGDGSKPEIFRAWFDESLADRIAFATVDASTGDVVGSSSFMSFAPEHRRVEIGHTWLAPSHWRTGANVEAKLLMLEHAFGPMGMRRVEFKTDAGNERSRRALEALPARFEGIHRQHMLVRDGENRDSAWYSVLDFGVARGAGEPARPAGTRLAGAGGAFAPRRTPRSSSSAPGSRIASTWSPRRSSVEPTAISALPSRITEMRRAVSGSWSSLDPLADGGAPSRDLDLDDLEVLARSWSRWTSSCSGTSCSMSAMTIARRRDRRRDAEQVEVLLVARVVHARDRPSATP